MENSAKKQYRIIGMMSGTSLDGVDLSCCLYQFESRWTFQLEAAKTYPYPSSIIESIGVMQDLSSSFLTVKREELKYSQFISELVLTFIQANNLKQVDYVSMHGHTIFHHPREKITIQVGNLPMIAALTGIDVIGNFRELDVMRGGEGAPLAPYGDELFEGDVLINFGGVANLGCLRKGWDINFCNLFFNYFVQLISQCPFDMGGMIGKSGSLNKEVLEYFQAKWKFHGQLSLQRQQFQVLARNLINTFGNISKVDLLTTYYHYLAQQIVSATEQIVKLTNFSGKEQKIQVVCTGGGAKNIFLIELIRQYSSRHYNFIVAAQDIVQFKEAILFGFLGVKYLEGINNCGHGVGGLLAKGSYGSLN